MGQAVPSRDRPGPPGVLVLVVDDERGTVALMRDMLQYAGFEVEIAYDGLEALVRARELRPALLLSDVMMPGLDGRDLCRALRDDPGTADMVLVLHSSMDEVEVDWREAGADAFLQKPFRIGELPARLHVWLALRGRRAAGGR